MYKLYQNKLLGNNKHISNAYREIRRNIMGIPLHIQSLALKHKHLISRHTHMNIITFKHNKYIT